MCIRGASLPDPHLHHHGTSPAVPGSSPLILYGPPNRYTVHGAVGADMAAERSALERPPADRLEPLRKTARTEARLARRPAVPDGGPRDPSDGLAAVGAAWHRSPTSAKGLRAHLPSTQELCWFIVSLPSPSRAACVR